MSDNMYCPLCGGLLEQSELPVCLSSIDAVEDYDLYGIREEYICLGRGCFKADYPLYYHHPFRGINSAPGDSWSLSWVK